MKRVPGRPDKRYICSVWPDTDQRGKDRWSWEVTFNKTGDEYGGPSEPGVVIGSGSDSKRHNAERAAEDICRNHSYNRRMEWEAKEAMSPRTWHPLI